MDGLRWQIWRNVWVVSGLFFLLFASFSCVANIQSSVNIEASLGTTALGAIASI